MREKKRGGPRPGAGRPVRGEPRDAQLQMRVPVGKLAAWRAAAVRVGQTLTEWAEALLDAAAKR